MAELKPCPFCGSQATTEVQVTQMGGGTDQIDFGIVCPSCNIDRTCRLKINKKCTFKDVDEAMNLAIEAWNRRSENG